MSNTDSTTPEYSKGLTYAVYGHHKGKYFPDITGCYTRNVRGDRVAEVIAHAETQGWWNLSASPEAF